MLLYHGLSEDPCLQIVMSTLGMCVNLEDYKNHVIIKNKRNIRLVLGLSFQHSVPHYTGLNVNFSKGPTQTTYQTSQLSLLS